MHIFCLQSQAMGFAATPDVLSIIFTELESSRKEMFMPDLLWYVLACSDRASELLKPLFTGISKPNPGVSDNSISRM